MTDSKELKWPMDKIRQTFFDFFVQQYDHVFWPSSPCVPVEDPTLLFTNAGMNQFKPLFLGTCDPNLEMSKLTRVVNAQKCIRAGGKHNDLDDVGKDVYHHTFFEMLGNWSFGNYFKKEAIEMAWKCLTVEFGLNPDRLYATYFGGDEYTPCDNEAKEIWLQYLPENRVLPFAAKDNFWEMGATGPCGPCTEIHYDRIGNRDASKLVNADLPDVIEIWNNVFIQYTREVDGSLRTLPAQHVDTGMGFERLASILQGVDSNYDTDIFVPLFTAIQHITGARPYSGKVGKDDSDFVDMAYRVVADHIRTLSFSIADGAMPSNDGRGYVLRRILRRAVRYGRQNLGAALGFFAKLVPALVENMRTMYPELKEKQDHITAIIMEEEESFSRTLDKGLQKFNELSQKVGTDKVFSGEDAHFLYTSMGFPVDLTQLMAEEKGLTLDTAGFEKKMEEDRKISEVAHQQKMAAGSGKDMRLVAEQISYLVGQSVNGTDDSSKYVWNTSLDNCVVQACFIGRNETEDNIGFVTSMTSENGVVGIILSQSSYYAESGGQIYDTGVIKSSTAAFKVTNVQLYGQFVLHIGIVESGTIAVGDIVSCFVDYERRHTIASNHTMTHILNYALKEVLVLRPQRDGTGKASTVEVDQKGSLVDEAKLRFDFSWNGPLTSTQLADVENLVNAQIEKALPVNSFVAPLTQAEKISSLRAVFGEKYPDPVRVVAVSYQPITDMLANPQDPQWSDYSVEFCGGTHLTNTKDAEAFVLLSEDGIAKGIRRIVGVTQADAKKAIVLANEFESKMQHCTSLKGDELESQIKLLKEELNLLAISSVKKVHYRDALNELTKQVLAYNKQKLAGMTDEIVNAAITAATEQGGNKIVFQYDFGCDGKVAKSVTQAFLKKTKDQALLLITADANDNKFMIVTCSPKSLSDIDCKAWIETSTNELSSDSVKGGGKKDSAVYYVTGLENITTVLEKAKLF